MPRKPRVACPVPGCPELTTGGRCAEHKRQDNRLRGSASAQGYGTKWQRRRKAFVYANPWCVLCARPTTVADHYPQSRKTLVSQGVPDPDLPQYLRPLCTPCHNKETARHQPGGWAAERLSRRTE